MKPITEFAWSLGRSRIWNGCLTRYYIQYLFSNGTGREGEEKEMWTASKLKHLTQLPIESGLLIHNKIRDILTSVRMGRPIPVPEISATNAAYDFAKWVKQSEKIPWNKINASNKKLLRHQRGETISRAEIQYHVDTVRRALINFHEVPLVREIMRHPDRLLPQLIDSSTFEVVTVNGIKLLTRPDAVLSGEEPIVIDWKTGKPHIDHQRSATLLDIYIRTMFNLPPAHPLKVACVYLTEGAVEEYVITDEQREELLILAEFEFNEMRLQHLRFENGERVGSIFPPSPRTEVCGDCPFSVVCPFAKTKKI